MMKALGVSAVLVAGLGCVACSARQPAAPAGIALEDPHEVAAVGGASAAPSSGLIASGTDPATASPAREDGFVYSREPKGPEAAEGSALPIHINETWWPFRAQYLGISAAEAQKRDAELSQVRAPAAFWDSQTAIEAVSVWSVLCNECHGGRRSLEDAREMPEPAPAWGEGEGLFFGNRRAYQHMFEVVEYGGPKREAGRAEMPAWRNILAVEMRWALLYFLEYQSGGIESRFPPSLYPRRPKGLGQP
jgi:hypothetical protein